MLQKYTCLQLWLKLGQKVHVNGPVHWYAKIIAIKGYNGIMGCFERRRDAHLYSSKGTHPLSFSHGKLIT